MLLEVTFYSLTGTSGDVHPEPFGVIRYDGNIFTIDPPDSVALRSVLSRNVLDMATRKPVTAKSDPERWMENLRFQYRSAYLRAGEAKRS
jgi:hypothetical protein